MTRKSVPVLAAAALIVATGIGAPPAEAAWWPWSKRDRQTADQPVPHAAAAPVTVAQADVADRLNRAEERIRELTGQVEELSYRVRQLQQQLGIQSGDARPDAGVVITPDPLAGAIAGETGEPLGRLIIDAPTNPNQPIDLTATGGGTVAAPTANLRGSTQVVSLGDPGADYERAYGSILSGDYELAEASFRVFLSTYPTDARAADAQYWLGESYFARGQFGEAADEFLAGYKAFPQSAKAADTLLKLGLSLAGLGEREAACSTYAEVLRKYPDASNALRQRVAAEQAVASC